MELCEKNECVKMNGGKPTKKVDYESSGVIVRKTKDGSFKHTHITTRISKTHN
jgi:hypothetical protein